jgi:ribosomal RNA assembly protein
MSFEKLIRIPNERIAVLIGKSGSSKSKIEEICHVTLDIDGDTGENVERIKGRLIGESGKARRNMENLTGTLISVYGKTVSIIGDPNKLRLTVDAISSISNGSMHGAVYNKLEAANRRGKQEKMKLWEDQNVFD